MKPTIPPISSIAELYHQITIRCLNDTEQTLVFGFIERNQLEGFVNLAIEEIEVIVHNLKMKNTLKVDQIKTIAYTFLKQFNQGLAALEHIEEKTTLKKLLAKIANGIMLEIQQQAPGFAKDIKKAIEQGLEQAVVLEGYDKKDFENYFQIDYTDISKVAVTVTEGPEVSEYFTWNHKKGYLKKLSFCLQKDYGSIKSKSEFELIFDHSQKNDLVRWNAKQGDFLILLLSRLYQERFINLKGGKGIWKVVTSRFVDFEKKPLDIDPARRLNFLKAKNQPKSALIADVESILDHIKAV